MRKNAGGGTETLERFLDSTLDSVDRAEAVTLQAAEKAGFEEDDLNKIGMAVREAVVNAVVHGNRYSKHKKVRLSISKAAERFMVKVSDEGEGFDWNGLPDPLAQENLLRSSGRGIFLMRAFMDEIEIRKNADSGTEVTLVKYTSSR